MRGIILVLLWMMLFCSVGIEEHELRFHHIEVHEGVCNLHVRWYFHERYLSRLTVCSNTNEIYIKPAGFGVEFLSKINDAKLNISAENEVGQYGLYFGNRYLGPVNDEHLLIMKKVGLEFEG